MHAGEIELGISVMAAKITRRRVKPISTRMPQPGLQYKVQHPLLRSEHGKEKEEESIFSPVA